MCAAEATVVMGDVLPPHVTAAIVNEDNSAAAIVLVPVSLPEGGERWGKEGGGGFHLQRSTSYSHPQQTEVPCSVCFL